LGLITVFVQRPSYKVTVTRNKYVMFRNRMRVRLTPKIVMLRCCINSDGSRVAFLWYQTTVFIPTDCNVLFFFYVLFL